MGKLLNRFLMSGGGAGGGGLDVSTVFSIDLWTGNKPASQNIVSDLDGVGGDVLTWGKCREFTYGNTLIDTVRGSDKFISSNSANAEGTFNQIITSFNVDGYTIGNSNEFNNGAYDYVGWSFKAAPKFFAMIKVTKNSSVQLFAHTLNAIVGLARVKSLATGAWYTWHKDFASDEYILFNDTSAKVTGQTNRWNNTSPTSTDITLGSDFANGDYIIYLDAHDPSDSGIIQCGDFDATGGNVFIDLGWPEGAQYVEIKTYEVAGDWEDFDTTRGMTKELNPNLSAVESTVNRVVTTAGGFTFIPNEAKKYMFKAIRATA